LRPRYLGDSYDIVKQSFLRWLRDCGAWAAHPMFTERVTPEEADVFSRLLGVPLLSSDVLEAETNREAYFASARSCQDHLFLDPDTGLRLKVDRTKNHPSYLFGPEVLSIVSERPTSLTLVFDQSLARGREREQLAEKMAFLGKRGVYSFAYVSHACFILMSTDQELVKKASGVIQDASALPAARFVMDTRTT
jgi:hypothetical protein